MKQITIYTKGKTKENPGPAAIAVLVSAEDETVLSYSESIGNANSEYAEFFAVVRGLQSVQEKLADKLDECTVELVLADETLYKQLSNKLPITSASLVPLFVEVHNLRVASFSNIAITFLNKNQNREIDQLLDEALGV